MTFAKGGLPVSDLVLRRDIGRVATLTINRPEKMNALTLDLFEELNGHVADLETDDGIGVVVVRGAGRCFSAGNDLGGNAQGVQPTRANLQAHVIERLANLPKPVVAGVHGACFTGGLELALAADIILASESARFADTHARFSLTPVWGMSQRLPRRIGVYRARDLMFTCRTVSGAEAATIGLANRCVPDEDFDEALQSLAEGMASLSAFSHRALKSLLLETDGLPLSSGLSHEIYHTAGRGPDMQQRIEAFQKRK